MNDKSDVISISEKSSLYQKKLPTAAYIHIPFCRRRCYYCDFPISVVSDRKSNTLGTTVEDYVGALVSEIQLTHGEKFPLKTVFFGGGTPSLLQPQEIGFILQAIDKYLGIATDAEISMEIDPGTFDRPQLQRYLDCGINRISLGVQSFDPELLAICGRSHNLDDIDRAIEIVKELEVKNFSLDLISGLPHQTLEKCRDSLEKAIAVSPHHLSCYDLVLEPVTAFGKQYQAGETPLPNDTNTAEMYRLTQRLLTNAGYRHYEVSNYARDGWQCRHNRVYWENKFYYGFGMGAASYVAGKRFTRPKTRREYYAWLQDGAAIDVEPTSTNDFILEKLMLGLRLAEGVSLKEFELKIRKQILTCLQPYFDKNWLEIKDSRGSIITFQELNLANIEDAKLCLSDPEGFLFSNTILTTLFEELDIVVES